MMRRKMSQGEELYSLDFGNVRMLMMDSSFLTEERRQSMGKDAWAKEEQRVEAWIRSRAGSCEKPWLAAVIHHPVYGTRGEDTVSPQIRRLWAPLLETGGVGSYFQDISTCISERDPFMESCI